MKRTRDQEVSLEGFLDYLDSKIPDAIKKIRDEKDEKTLIAQLKAENASLWALAKFGKWCLSSPEDEFDDTALYSKAAEFGLIKFTAYAEAIETPLAKLPEKRE